MARGDGCGLVQGSREEGETEDLSKARKEAHDLYEAGEKKWSTDESTFNTILGTRSYVQLRATFEEYEKVGVARVWGESGNIFW